MGHSGIKMRDIKKLLTLRGFFSFTFLLLVVFSITSLILVNSDWNVKKVHLMAPSVDTFERILPAGQNSTLTALQKGYQVTCRPYQQPDSNLCGLVLVMPKKAGKGFPLDDYQSIAFNISTQSDADNFDGRVRVFVKSYLDDSKEAVDFVRDYKFHAVRVDRNGFIRVPLSRFKVETWWEDMHNIPFDLSYVDLSTVHSIEFFIHKLPLQDGAEYKLAVDSLEVTGVYVFKDILYMILFYAWLVFCVLFYFIFRYKEAKKIKSKAFIETHSKLLNMNGFEEKYQKIIGQDVVLYKVKVLNWNNLVRNFGTTMSHFVLREIVLKNYVFYRSFFYVSARINHDELVFIRRRKTLSKEDEERFVNTFTTPVNVVGLGELRLDIKVGATIEKSAPFNAKVMLERADIASQSILNKDERIQFFSNEISQQAEKKSNIARQIRLALNENAFYLLYMPIFSASKQKIVGVEALLRCNFGDLKNMSPEVYISVAEEKGLIRDIDFMVINMALNDIASSGFDDDFIISINISSQELLDTSFVGRFKEIVERTGVAYQRICLEITETFLIEVDAVCVKTIKDLRRLGCRLSLDDFGTGYTSFQQLLNFPVDEIKIDRSFIGGIEGKESHEVIVDSLVSIAHSYEYHVVAEGVETKSTFDKLVSKNCDLVQGYYISKPTSLVELAMLSEKIENGEVRF